MLHSSNDYIGELWSQFWLFQYQYCVTAPFGWQVMMSVTTNVSLHTFFKWENGAWWEFAARLFNVWLTDNCFLHPLSACSFIPETFQGFGVPLHRRSVSHLLQHPPGFVVFGPLTQVAILLVHLFVRWNNSLTNSHSGGCGYFFWITSLCLGAWDTSPQGPISAFSHNAPILPLTSNFSRPVTRQTIKHYIVWQHVSNLHYIDTHYMSSTSNFF